MAAFTDRRLRVKPKDLALRWKVLHKDKNKLPRARRSFISNKRSAKLEKEVTHSPYVRGYQVVIVSYRSSAGPVRKTERTLKEGMEDGALRTGAGWEGTKSTVRVSVRARSA